MTKEFMRQLAALDRAAEEAGGYLAFRTLEELDSEPRYNYPALSRYAKEKGVAPYELSEDERNRFLSAA